MATRVILFYAIAGSGKSWLSIMLADQNPGSYILSKDDFRTKNGVYKFDPSSEPDIEKEYFDMLEGFLLSKKHSLLILDNTHLSPAFYRKSVCLFNKYNIVFLTIAITPLNNINKHLSLNVHNLDVTDIERQKKDWFENKDELLNVIYFAHHLA